MKVVVVGSESNEELICDEIRQQGLEASHIQLSAPDRFNFEVKPLTELDPKSHEVIICLDARGLNFSRAKLYMDIRLAGFRLRKHVSQTALVSSDTTFGDGAFVGPMTVIGPSAKFGANVRIGARVTIGRNAKIAKHVSIGDGAYIGDNVTLAENVNVGTGAIIASGTTIGRYSDLQIRQEYSGEIPEMSFFWWNGFGAARVYDFSR